VSLKLHLTGKRTDDGNRIWCILGWNVTNVVYLLVDPGFLCPLNFYKASRSVPPKKMDASDRHNGQTNACPSDGVWHYSRYWRSRTYREIYPLFFCIQTVTRILFVAVNANDDRTHTPQLIFSRWERNDVRLVIQNLQSHRRWNMDGTRTFELGGSEVARHGGKIKLLLSDFQMRKISSRCFGR